MAHAVGTLEDTGEGGARCLVDVDDADHINSIGSAVSDVERHTRTVMRAIVIGEALVDVFEGRSVVAGAPLHVAAHLSGLGWDAALVSRVGRDHDGDVIVSVAGRHGIDVGLVERDVDLPTGRTIVEVDNSGEHTFDVLGPAAWDGLLGPQILPAHDVLVFGTLIGRNPGARRELRRMVTLSTGFKAVDMNLRPPHIAPDIVPYALAEADLLKVNEEELVFTAEEMRVDPDSAALARLGPEWVCVTRGAAGAELAHRDGRSWRVDGIETDVVDTVGAGDAFLAGLIDGLVTARDPDAALSMANALAVESVGRRGGLPRPAV